MWLKQDQRILATRGRCGKGGHRILAWIWKRGVGPAWWQGLHTDGSLDCGTIAAKTLNRNQ